MFRLDRYASSRNLLWAVALAASIVSVAALAALTASQYEHTLRKAEVTSENTARLLEEHVLRTFDGSLALLELLKDRLAAVGFNRIGSSRQEWRDHGDCESPAAG